MKKQKSVIILEKPRSLKDIAESLSRQASMNPMDPIPDMVLFYFSYYLGQVKKIIPNSKNQETLLDNDEIHKFIRFLIQEVAYDSCNAINGKRENETMNLESSNPSLEIEYLEEMKENIEQRILVIQEIDENKKKAN